MANSSRVPEAYPIQTPSQEDIDLRGLAPIPYRVAVSAPASQTKAVTPQIHDIAVPERTVTSDYLPESAEPTTAPEIRNTHRGGRIGVVVLMGALAVFGGKFVYNNLQPSPKQRIEKAQALPVPETTNSTDNLIPIEPTPEATLKLNLQDFQPEATATTIPKRAASSPTKKPQVSTSSPSVKVVIPPRATTPSIAPSTPNTSPTPTTTTPEAHANFPTSPGEASIRLLSDAANTQRAQELMNQDPNLADYLRAAQSGELDFLSKDSINDYRDNAFFKVYHNPDVSSILGEPQYIDDQTLDATDNPARLVVNFTDNALRHASEVFPMTGEDISKAAYLNPELSSKLTSDLFNQNDVSVSDSANEAVIGKVRKVNGIAVVPVVAEYAKASNTYTVFRWEALVPVKTDRSFVAVTVFEKQLNTFKTDSSTTPPPETTPPTSGSPEDSNYDNRNSAKQTHGQGKKNHNE